jgi:hypothetical protein
MGENWDIARDHQVEEKFLQLGRRRVVRRLDQHVARISNGQESAGTKPRNEIWGHMDVGPRNKAKRNTLLIEKLLQSMDRVPDVGPRVMIKPGQNMRGARNSRHALRGHKPRHGEGDGRIASPVVDSWQDMAVQIDQVDDSPENTGIAYT